jgi:hypothetical protein
MRVKIVLTKITETSIPVSLMHKNHWFFAQFVYYMSGDVVDTPFITWDATAVTGAHLA